MKKFRIQVFGALELFAPSGERVVVTGAKQQALLAYLALHPDQPVSRDRMIALLWGDRFADQARQSLRQAISKLRRMLSDGDANALWADNDRIGLNLDLVSIDLSDFSALARQDEPSAWVEAVSIFNSALLDGLYVREAAFEDWLATERSRVNDLAFPVFERAVKHLLSSGEQSRSIEIAQRQVALDPLRESSHRLLMRILAQSGQRAAAIQKYQTCAEILERELGVEPDPETKRVLKEIKSPGSLGPVEPENVGEALPAPTTSKSKGDEAAQTENPAPVVNTTKVTISVLPFHQSGGDLADFAAGLADETRLALNKYRWLDLIAQLPEEEENTGIAEMRLSARAKRIRYAVEGSVRKIGARVRITAQLVELNSGKYVWVHRYDRDEAELFDALDEISEVIAATVESELVAFEGEKARSKSAGSMSAWDCYHLGLATQYEFSSEGNARAQALFRRAITLDPQFAAAYARLSYAIVLSAIYFEADQRGGLLEEALELARTATRLDDKDAVARFALGRTHLARQEYLDSIAELEHAIALNPGLAQAHCGLGDSLAYLGRIDDAVPRFEEAIRLSPHDPHRWAFSMYGAIALIFSGDYEKAAEWANVAVRVPNSHYWANAALVSALGHLARVKEAEIARVELMKLKPDFSRQFARERLFYLQDEEQLQRYLDGLELAGVSA